MSLSSLSAWTFQLTEERIICENAREAVLITQRGPRPQSMCSGQGFSLQCRLTHSFTEKRYGLTS